MMELFDSNDFIKILGTKSNISVLKVSPTVSYERGHILDYGVISNTQISNFGLSLIGDLPAEDQNKNEIALTRYAAYQIGLLDEGNLNDDLVINSIIGKSAIIGLDYGTEYTEKSYVISGIIDTKYKFPNEKLFQENSTYQYIEKDRLYYEMHTTVFFSQERYQSLNQKFILGNGLSEDVSADTYFVNVRGENYEKALAFLAKYAAGDVTLDSRLRYSLMMLNNMRGTFWQLALIIGIVFFIISSLTFINYVHNMLLNRETSIQILRSLGTGFGSTNKIFIVQNIMLSSITTIVSSLIAVIAGINLNAAIFKNFFVSIPMINISVVTVILMFIFVFVLFSLTSLVQLLKNYSQKRVIKKS